MLELKKLKFEIENNSLSTHFIIYVCDKVSTFIPHQYALEFCNKNNFDIFNLEDINSFPKQSLFNTPENNLYLYKVETLDEELPIEQEEVSVNYIWVICNKVSAKIKKIYENNIVQIPKLEEWQIKDYINTTCKLDETQTTTLLDNYKGDLFRLTNELEKIKLFDYDTVKSQLYVDTTTLNIFDLTNSIIRKDKKTLSNILYNIDIIDIDVFGLINLLLKNFKYVIDIQLGKNTSAESMGISGKQFWAIQKYSCGFYSKEQLVFIYGLLNDLDYQIKTGSIDIKLVIDYIICKIITL